MNSYTFRRSTLTIPETWTIFKEGIRSEEGTRPPIDYSFGNLHSIRLSYYPTRMKPNNYVCTLTFHASISGQTQTQFEIKIMSVSYKSFATFEDKANAYRIFIGALVAAAKIENPAVQLISGKKTGTFIAENIAVVAILAILYYLFSILGAPGVSIYMIIKLSIIVYSLFYIWKAFKANKPGSFDPYHIPEKVLPNQIAI